MKRILLAAAAFLWVCLLGFLIALAGGIEWGTVPAGATMFMAFALGTTVACLVMASGRD